MATMLPLYNINGTIIGYVMHDGAPPFPSSPAPKKAVSRTTRRTTKASRLHDRRVKAAVAYVTMRSGQYGVSYVAEVLLGEKAFDGLAKATIRQFLYKLVSAGTIAKTDDGLLYCPPVPDDVSSLTEAEDVVTR